MAARLARDLPGFLRAGLTYETAIALVRDWLDNREARFLNNVRRFIYGHPMSPYLRLLGHAGCEFGDVEALVRHEGLEGALSALAARGVYVTFDEFKGRRAVVRGSARFAFTAEQFDHPAMTPHFVAYTGGTRGEPSVVKRSLPMVHAAAASTAAILMAHRLVGARHAFWVTGPVPPMLSYSLLGEDVLRWFHTAPAFPRKAWVGTRIIAAGARLGGKRLPVARFLPPEQAERLVRWIDRRPRDGRPFVLSTLTSMAVRAALTASEAGIDLTGVTFRLQSEPLTPARYGHLRAVGAGVIDNYSLMEATDIAYSCGVPGAANDLHLLAERYALTTRTRAVLDDGPEVQAMLLTSLSDLAPKVCLNVETGDYARIERRACGCFLGELGLTTQLSDVRSFEKLSAEGVTFVSTRLIEILESVLPAQFGGNSLDYQLLEEEAADSSTRLILRVTPGVGAIDEAAVRAVFLAELGRGSTVDRYQAELLRRAGSLTISRQAPQMTAAGKVFPFHLLRAADATPGARRDLA